MLVMKLAQDDSGMSLSSYFKNDNVHDLTLEFSFEDLECSSQRSIF